MNVYVTTRARLFQPEQFMEVHSTRKKAENYLRNNYLHMRKSEKDDCYYADANKQLLLFIREKEVL